MQGIEHIQNFWRVKPDLHRIVTKVWGVIVPELSDKCVENDISEMEKCVISWLQSPSQKNN